MTPYIRGLQQQRGRSLCRQLARLGVGVLAAGIALAAVSDGRAYADLITNGNFATGDFTGWSISGDTGNLNVDTLAANIGDTYGAEFSSYPPDSATLTQSGLGTTAGASYTLTFAVENTSSANLFSGTPDGSFTIDFDGQQVDSYDEWGWSGDGLGYLSVSYTVTALDTGSTLSFTGSNGGGSWYLDDVSLVPLTPVTVPEPSSLVLLLAALGGLPGIRRLRRG